MKIRASLRPLGGIALALLLTSPVRAADASTPDWAKLREQLRTSRNFRLGAPFNITPLKDGHTILYSKATPPSLAASIYAFDRNKNEETKILDEGMLTTGGGHESAEEKALRERLRMLTAGLSFFDVDASGRWIVVPLKGKLFAYDRDNKKAHEIAPGASPIFGPVISPDGKSVAFVRDSNVFVAPVAGGSARAITRGGTEEKSYGVAEFIAQEELERKSGLWWSPDSASLLIEAIDQSKVERLSISDPYKPDEEPNRPYYPRPGKTNVAVRFGFVPAAGGTIKWVKLPENFEYVGPVEWPKDGRPTLMALNRLQTDLKLVAADPKSGQTETLIHETDKAWVEIDHSVPLWLPHNQGFLWTSQRTGPKRLELHDAEGKFVKMVSPETMQVRSVLGLSEDGGTVYFEATSDAVASTLQATDLKTAATKEIASEPAGSVSHSGHFDPKVLAARIVRLNGDDVTLVKGWNEGGAATLPSTAETPIYNARVTLERTGPDAIRTAVIKPVNFAANKKYAVIEHAYGGPSSLMVNAAGRGYLEDQVLADALDAIVVRFDTRGTPDRGHDWEKAISRRFGSLPVNEHAEALKLFCARHAECDAARVGVYGWSYGGYFTAYAVLARPDVYKSGVAGAPPVDWLDYDTAYTERYLGLPASDKAAYDSGSLLGLVKKGKDYRQASPLLLIHGTADDNVYFFNSMKLIDALERAAYPYQFLPLMGQTHIVADGELNARRFQRTLDFFQATLKPLKPETH